MNSSEVKDVIMVESTLQEINFESKESSIFFTSDTSSHTLETLGPVPSNSASVLTCHPGPDRAGTKGSIYILSLPFFFPPLVPTHLRTQQSLSASQFLFLREKASEELLGGGRKIILSFSGWGSSALLGDQENITGTLPTLKLFLWSELIAFT